MKSITTIEYKKFGSILRVSKKVQVKKAVMDENSKRFILVLNSLILNRRMIEQIGVFREKSYLQQLLHNGQPIPGASK